MSRRLKVCIHRDPMRAYRKERDHSDLIENMIKTNHKKSTCRGNSSCLWQTGQRDCRLQNRERCRPSPGCLCCCRLSRVTPPLCRLPMYRLMTKLAFCFLTGLRYRATISRGCGYYAIRTSAKLAPTTTVLDYAVVRRRPPHAHLASAMRYTWRSRNSNDSCCSNRVTEGRPLDVIWLPQENGQFPSRMQLWAISTDSTCCCCAVAAPHNMDINSFQSFWRIVRRIQTPSAMIKKNLHRWSWAVTR